MRIGNRPSPQLRGLDDTLARVAVALLKVRPSLARSEIRGPASLMHDLGIDSLKFAELSLALEETFDRPIFLGDLLADLEDPGGVTVDQLARFILEKG